jgi:carboxyl-terminal processing protease
MRDARKYDEGSGGALKVTIQKFYRVSGASTQLKGVVPDVVLPTPWDGLEVLEGDLDSALAWDEIPPIPHSTAGGFADVLPGLIASSKQRVAGSGEFQKMAEDVAKREKRMADPTVSLNIEARRAEFAAATAEEKEEAKDEVESESRTPKMLLDEGVNVLADLVAAK